MLHLRRKLSRERIELINIARQSYLASETRLSRERNEQKEQNENQIK